MQIKTIVHDVPEEFDAQVNQALQSGYALIQRGLVQVTDRSSSLYCELVKYDSPSPIDPDVPKEAEDSGQDCPGECECGCVCVDSVLNVMKFIQWCCKTHDFCPACPVYEYCRGNLPHEWNLEDK